MSNLNPEKALIFRITHIANVPWILSNGLHCSNGPIADPNYVQIGNSDIIARRNARPVPVPPGGMLSDYVPFYFTPYSPMLLNIKTGYNGVTRRTVDEIVILVSSLRELHKQGIQFVFTDRHAYLQTAEFHNCLDRLDCIDWPRLQARDFRRDPDDPGKVERYQAEALIYWHVPMTAILGIICFCYRQEQQKKIETDCGNLNLATNVFCRPGWYL
jgi:ssDNA thymidine ADP-ribosyltransferase DarT-like protein